jgi:hypothetical protein
LEEEKRRKRWRCQTNNEEKEKKLKEGPRIKRAMSIKGKSVLYTKEGKN